MLRGTTRDHVSQLGSESPVKIVGIRSPTVVRLAIG
jgi:hypothetical protein